MRVEEYPKDHTDVRSDDDNAQLDNWAYKSNNGENIHSDNPHFDTGETQSSCTCEGACQCNVTDKNYPVQCTETGSTIGKYPDWSSRFYQYECKGELYLLGAVAPTPSYYTAPYDIINEPLNNIGFTRRWSVPEYGQQELEPVYRRTEFGRVMGSPESNQLFENEVEREDLFDHRGIHQLALLDAPPLYVNEVVRVDEVTE